MGCWVFSATCRMMEWTILLLLYLSSHLTISSGDTLRFDRSIYPVFAIRQTRFNKCASASLTLLLVYPQNHDDLVTPDSDKFLDTSNTTSREFGEQDHAVDVVILQQLDIGSHFCNLRRQSASVPEPPSLGAGDPIPASRSPSRSYRSRGTFPHRNGNLLKT